MDCGIDGSGNAVSQPLDSLQSLLEWHPPKFKLCTSARTGKCQHSGSVSQAHKYSEQVVSRPKVLVCHDMAGGYLDDRFIHGCLRSSNAYVFYHWQLIDTFVYFSHHFITIPPPGWILAAHRHGVNVLGTIITEWDDGAETCKQMLESEGRVDELTTKLADLAVYFGFDGWLINIENNVEPGQIPLLTAFVQQLTQKCHSRLQGGTVLWYDSVISSGKLIWQDELNASNEMFFDVCDGIFLNYCITKEKLSCSKKKASCSKRQQDVYVGVDVFGRGTPGGGGFNCREVLEMIVSEGLSCAFFAPGWVMENLGPELFQENNNKFWGLLSDLLTTRPTLLPFSTSFCQGNGEKYFLNGEVALDRSWFNLALQQIQPTFTQSQFLSYSNTKDAGKASEAQDVDKRDHDESSKGEKKTSAESKLSLEKDEKSGENNSVTKQALSGNVKSEREFEMKEFAALPSSGIGCEEKSFSKKMEIAKRETLDKVSREKNQSSSTKGEGAVEETTESADPEAGSLDVKEEIKVAVVTEKMLPAYSPNMALDLSCGFNGGGCLRLQAPRVPGQPVVFKLFNISGIEELKQLDVTWRTQQDCPCHFGLLLSPVSKKASLENATVLFETGMSASAADLLHKRTSGLVVHIRPEPERSPHTAAWTTRTHRLDHVSLHTDAGGVTGDVTLSALLLPLDPLENGGDSHGVGSMCVWLGCIKASTSFALTVKKHQPRAYNIHCLEVKSGAKLTSADLEQVVKHPCLADKFPVSDVMEGLESAPESGVDLFSAAPSKVAKMSVDIDREALERRASHPAVWKKLDLTNCDRPNVEPSLFLYLLKWDVADQSNIDNFLIYLVSDDGSKTFLGFSSSTKFVFSNKSAIGNPSFFIQPVLL